MVVFEKEETNEIVLSKALEKGILIHKLLQYLPEIPPENRRQKLQELTPKGIEVPYQILDLMEKPEISDLFGKNSLPEVPIIGELNGQKLAGQIDRLVIRTDDILIIDYKTNKKVPKTVPDNYRVQLNAYRDLIKKIFPDRIVKSYLLWTENLTLMEVQ